MIKLIVIKQFLDRHEELSSLNERYRSSKAEFVVLYGRRRIGKSKLIDEFLKDKTGIRLLAREETQSMTLERFTKNIADLLEDRTLDQASFRDWDGFFEYINEKTREERMVIAIDEFPYLIEQNDAFPSILQDHWDGDLENSKIFLIICGSVVGAMESIMGHKSPLYGRRTSQILLKPIGFISLFREIDIDMEKAVEFYSVFGGTPPYFTEADLNKPLGYNLEKKVFQYDSFLLRDVEFVLRSELRKPHLYMAILTAIAEGKTTVNEIVNYTGIDRTIIGRYLSILRDLKLVKRDVPITEDKHRSRHGVYKIKDNFFRFWFKFIYPNQMIVERGKPENITSIVLEELPGYIGPIFEDICMEYIWENYDYTKVGKWWFKDWEIDIVGLDSNRILFGECKWSEDVDPKKQYHLLKKKSREVRWGDETRTEEFVLFAKTFKTKFDAEDLRCIDLEEFEKTIKRS